MAVVVIMSRSVCVRLSVYLCVLSRQFLSKQPSLLCLIHFWGSSGAAQGQKETFNGKPLSMKDDLWWKTTFDGSQPSMEDGF